MLILWRKIPDKPDVIRCASAEILSGGCIMVKLEDKSANQIIISPNGYLTARIWNAQALSRKLGLE